MQGVNVLLMSPGALGTVWELQTPTLTALAVLAATSAMRACGDRVDVKTLELQRKWAPGRLQTSVTAVSQCLTQHRYALERSMQQQVGTADNM